MGEPLPTEPVRRLEDHLAETVAKMDTWLEQGRAIRSEFALKLHALREADNVVVDEAIDDFERRMAEDVPYEDAMDADDLIAAARRR